MGFAINTNTSALNSYRNLTNTQNDISKSLEKLSTGLRINRAADDAAGLSISEGLRSQVNGLNVAARNAQDGISVIQTAEGALTEVHSILQRMRDLAVQGANDSNNGDAREAIKAESDALVSELGRIAESTNFNGINLLNGTAGTAKDGNLSFQVGADGDASSKINVDLKSANVAAVTNSLKGLTAAGAAGTDAGSVNVSGITFAAVTTAGAVTISQGEGKSFAIDLATTDTATTILDKMQKAAGEDFTVSHDATNGFTIVSNDLSLTDKVANKISVAPGTSAGGLVTTSAVDANEDAAKLGFSTNAEAQTSIRLLDHQIRNVSSARSELGASQNRLESSIKHINVSAENLAASESRIRDADMAKEMASFTKSQIMSQAGTAMLAQANQINQGVLQLLG